MSQLTLTLPNGQQISYLLERRARKSIGLRISDHGLVVHAPKRVAQSYLEAVLMSKAHWIVSKLEARDARKLPPFQWQDGACLRLLGAPLYLALHIATKKRKIEHIQDAIHVTVSEIEDEAAIAKQVTLWLKQYALIDFERRITLFAAKLNRPMPKVLLSNARSRWGSCNSKGEIRLNWRLIQAPPHIINYVVCHELAHLIEMNHSAKFWQQVASIFPQYQEAEKELKSLSASLHNL
jgi:predicted metal-dependent hydrolase